MTGTEEETRRMPTRLNHRPYQPCSSLGVSMSEYAILLGLVSILGLSALPLLSGSFTDLSYGFGETLATNLPFLGIEPPKNKPSPLQWQAGSGNSTPAPSSPSVSSQAPPPKTTPTAKTPAELEAKGYYTIKADSETKQPSLQLSDGGSLGATNVTSVEGTYLNTMDSLQSAAKLEQLASASPSAPVSKYYQNAANLTYYLGGAQGTLDNLPELTQATEKPDTYTNGDALRDLFLYKNELRALLKDPPQEMSPQEYREFLKWAASAYNTAQAYLNQYDRFIDAEGNVARNFGKPGECVEKACLIGNGMPGSGLENAEDAAYTSRVPSMSGMSYGSVMTIQRLKNITAQLLKNSKTLALAGRNAHPNLNTTPAVAPEDKGVYTASTAGGGLPLGKSDQQVAVLIALMVISIVGGALLYYYNPFKPSNQ